MLIIIVLLIMAVLFASMSQKGKITESVNEGTVQIYSCFKKKYFILSFVIIALICAFNTTGTDMIYYANYYETWNIKDLFDPQFEIGNRLLFLGLHKYFENPYVGLAIVKTLSIALIFFSLYLLREKINISIALIAYIVLLYIFNFHLIRMMMAVGISFLAITFEIIGKRKTAICLMVLAFFFHYTSIIILCTYLLYLFFGKKGSLIKVCVVMITFSFVYANIGIIISKMISTFSVFSKYSVYVATDNYNGSGIVQILLFVPVIFILYQGYCENKNDKFFVLSMYLGIMTFFAGSMGSIYTVMSRTVYYFYSFFVLYCATTPLKQKDIIFIVGSLKIRLTSILLLAYLLMYGFVYYYLGMAFVTNGLEEYVPIWSVI